MRPGVLEPGFSEPGALKGWVAKRPSRVWLRNVTCRTKPPKGVRPVLAHFWPEMRMPGDEAKKSKKYFGLYREII